MLCCARRLFNGSLADLEVISNVDIRDATRSVEEDVDAVERRSGEMEEDASEEKIEPGPEGGTCAQTKEEDQKDEKIRGNPEQHRHVPRGMWLTQVWAYLRVNLLPEWMRGRKERERASRRPGRDWEEGIEGKSQC
ncbi:hypothetical protein NDU88_005303 [Pleurodeles waltl]|uniref:Uncharacterized protein n=1 Tax=Pleurodeles waltl TaxID=8319 RepID=A0AAV7RKL2_PLEWA|nr:hypothetical protein NDU88_005303 [Pleurodeles waltl]